MESKVAAVKDKMFQLAKATSRYKELQLGAGDYRQSDFKDAKADLTYRQSVLKTVLDKELRKTHGDNISAEDWASNYAPFHWVSEFYSIIVGNGGFDVVIGNPPYVGYTRKNKVTRKAVIDTYKVNGYKTLPTSNLYSFVIERSHYLAKPEAKIGMIIPISAFSTDRMSELRDFFRLKLGDVYISTFHQRPAQLFDGVLQRLCIFIAVNKVNSALQTTSIYRWNAENRYCLFDLISYQSNKMLEYESVWKIGNPTEASILRKYQHDKSISVYLRDDAHNAVYYRTAGGGYWVTFLNTPFDSVSLSNKSATFTSETDARVFSAVLNSNLYWWYYSVNYDLFNFKDYMIFGFAFNYDKTLKRELVNASDEMEKCLQDNSDYYVIKSQTRGDNETVTYHKELSKPIMDRIDTLLAKHYGFTEEELDYITNYDIKYRMGLGGSAETEEE